MKFIIRSFEEANGNYEVHKMNLLPELLSQESLLVQKIQVQSKKNVTLKELASSNFG